jgi:hypothetical protein
LHGAAPKSSIGMDYLCRFGEPSSDIEPHAPH